jgi:hypothetical protein
MGVAQRGVLSPLLFNAMLHASLAEATVCKASDPVMILFYADDILLVATEREPLERVVRGIESGLAQIKLELNSTKCQLLAVKADWSLTIGGRVVDKVSTLKYLGVLLDKDTSVEAEVLACIASGTNAFFAAAKLYNGKFNIHTKMAVYNATVRTILTYQAQSYNGVGMEKIALFDRSCLGRILRGFSPPTASKPYWSLWNNVKLHEKAGVARKFANCLLGRE